jgi:hypothetical protein
MVSVVLVDSVVCDVEVPARGDVRGTWCELVRRRFFSTFIMPSGIDPSAAEGLVGLPKGLTSPTVGGDIKGWSDNAVVGAAFAALGEPDEELPSGGMRPTENLEVVDKRDAREPGRNGDGTLGAW